MGMYRRIIPGVKAKLEEAVPSVHADDAGEFQSCRLLVPASIHGKKSPDISGDMNELFSDGNWSVVFRFIACPA
jgi:hypothetical protein